MNNLKDDFEKFSYLIEYVIFNLEDEIIYDDEIKEMASEIILFFKNNDFTFPKCVNSLFGSTFTRREKGGKRWKKRCKCLAPPLPEGIKVEKKVEKIFYILLL